MKTEDWYVRADEIVEGDHIYNALVVMSRAYLPNPEVMWMIRTTEWDVDGAFGFVERDRQVLRTAKRLVIQEELGWASITRSTTDSSSSGRSDGHPSTTSSPES